MVAVKYFHRFGIFYSPADSFIAEGIRHLIYDLLYLPFITVQVCNMRCAVTQNSTFFLFFGKFSVRLGKENSKAVYVQKRI